MATYENVRNLTVTCRVTAGVAAMQMYRFAKPVQTGTPEPFEFHTHVPGANGAAAFGICAMKPDAKNVQDGIVSTSIALPGCQALVELGEAITDLAVPLRIGGNAGEVDGAAYLANATGDVIVAWPLQLGVVGEIVSIFFVGYGGTAA
jgi:hypothetical protein